MHDGTESSGRKVITVVGSIPRLSISWWASAMSDHNSYDGVSFPPPLALRSVSWLCVSECDCVS